MSERWGKAFVKAIPLAIWIFALALTSIAGTYEWSRAAPLVVLFAVLVVVWLGMAMRGAITG